MEIKTPRGRHLHVAVDTSPEYLNPRNRPWDSDQLQCHLRCSWGYLRHPHGAGKCDTVLRPLGVEAGGEVGFVMHWKCQHPTLFNQLNSDCYSVFNQY